MIARLEVGKGLANLPSGGAASAQKSETELRIPGRWFGVRRANLAKLRKYAKIRMVFFS